MPKIKTNKSAAKRFKRTSTGKFKRFKAFARHLLTPKSQKRKRSLRNAVVVSEADAPRLKKMMPYS
ncbi:MAG: 50S ribosomal protein L35 [Candidatus Hydrogenedentes bacterium]|nr:50S ribosomal protein L35 [Candidatus Hydrogenedentota bacterium]